MAFPPFELPIESLTLEVISNGLRTQSPYSFAQTSYDFMGGAWGANINLAVMSDRERATFVRFLASLDGSFGTFELSALDYAGPFGSITVNPAIAVAASARAKSISISLAPGEFLVADDRITIDGHLHVVTVAASPVADVQAIDIWPRLRADVAISDAVEALAPFATWALASSRNTIGFSVDQRSMASIELIEAI